MVKTGKRSLKFKQIYRDLWVEEPVFDMYKWLAKKTNIPLKMLGTALLFYSAVNVPFITFVLEQLGLSHEEALELAVDLEEKAIELWKISRKALGNK